MSISFESKPGKNKGGRPPSNKVAFSIRIEPEVLDYFKSKGDGYQNLMNLVLRRAMIRMKGEETKKAAA